MSAQGGRFEVKGWADDGYPSLSPCVEVVEAADFADAVEMFADAHFLTGLSVSPDGRRASFDDGRIEVRRIEDPAI